MNKVLTILNQRFYLKEFLFLLFMFMMMEGIFSWIFIRNSIIIEGYQKLMGLLIYAFMMYSLGSMRKSERVIMAIFTIVMIRLIFESLFKYDSFFRQLTMFTVLFPVVYALFIKYVLRVFELDVLEFMAKFYLISYLVFMVLFGRGFSFSLESVEMNDYGPFSGDTRIIHASHIFMMIIPLLWYLNAFLQKRKNILLIPVFICIGLILLHQHRSVWSSALVSLGLYFIAMLRNRYLSTRGFLGILLVSVTFIMAACFVVSNLVPGFLDFMSDRFSEIFDPSKEGSTGNFRMEQRDVYFQLALERPVFGWTFEGFEMPNPLVDWWPEMTGQHFHEGYMEMIFYLGFAGLFLKYGYLIYLVYKIFSKHLSQESIIVSAFCISGLIFSLNYVLPLVYWGFVGMSLYYLELDKQRRKKRKFERSRGITEPHFSALSGS